MNRAAAQDEQTSDPHAGHDMSGHQGMGGMKMVDMNAASMFLTDLSSGTSVNPASWQMPMIMTPAGHWNTMFMGTGFL